MGDLSDGDLSDEAGPVRRTPAELEPGEPEPGRRSATTQTTLAAVAVAVLGVLPAYLTGALAVQIRADLGVGLAMFGFAAATMFAVSGVFARLGGRVVQRLGSRRGMALAAALSILSLTAVMLAQSPMWLMAALAIGGLGNAVAHPAANLGISEFVTEQRLGIAFGIKQSSIPAATLLCGLAVPGIAVVFGWRWAVAAAVALGVVLLVWTQVAGRDARGRAGATEPARSDRGLPRGGLFLLTLGGFLGSAASTSIGIFLVDSAVAAGVAPGAAGFLFAASSLLGLACRVVFGWLADRHPRRSHYLFIANLLAGGAIGYALLATGAVPFFVVGAPLAYALGWAWPGLFHFAVIKDNRAAAASVTGVVQTGLSLGAAAGPLLFGVVAQTWSYAVAWSMAGVLSLGAALTIRMARRAVRRSRGLPVGTLRRPGRPVTSHAEGPA